MPAAARVPGKLLVVDDYHYDLDFLCRGMIARGHEVLAAESSEEALKKIERSEIDLILLDGRMPNMDGVELLSVIRRRKGRLQLPVIMTTGWDQPDAVVQALAAGANDFVAKPLDLDVVSARVDTQLSLLQLLRQQEEFLAFATHDLRTPLSVILGYTAIIDRRLAAGTLTFEDLASYLDPLHRTASFMAEIVNDFVDFHALQAGSFQLKYEFVEVTDFLDFSITSTAEMARTKSLKLECDGFAGSLRIPCDRVRVRQVLQNLLGNAIKFCTPGCTIRLQASEANDVVKFEVIDDGPGIRDEDKKNLFKKFARLAAQPTGGEKSSGLGLSICKQIIQLHGGRIGADNNASGGATFWFTLPKARCVASPIPDS